MENIRERIIDLAYGETDDPAEMQKVLEIISNDPELEKFYETVKSDRRMLREDIYTEATDVMMDSNREKLFGSLPVQKKTSVNTSVFNLRDLYKNSGNLLKYAAVVLLTFYATMYHFGDKPATENGPRAFTTGAPDMNYRTVSTDQSDFASDFDKGQYIVDNLKIDEEGENIIIDFKVSTNKTIKGKKSDPNIINGLKYLIEHESNPGVKLRTLKAIDMSENNKYKDELISTMLNDENEIVRRKAIKILGRNAGDKDVKEALYQVVINDKDEINRIEALNILEKNSGEYAGKALKTISDEDNDYFRFKAANIENK